MRKRKILIGVPPKAHVSLAMDELKGLSALGWQCFTVPYGRNNQNVGLVNKLASTFARAIKLVAVLYKINPEFLYLNSRFEPAGSTRDFITLLFVKVFYFKKIKIIIKSHGSDCSLLQSNRFFYKKMLLPFLQKNVDAWFFLSMEEKNIITATDMVMGKKVVVLPNIIVPERCIASDAFKATHHLTADKFNLLFVGRMVAVKGIFDIVKSIALMKCRNEIKVTMVGDGIDMEKARELAINSGVADKLIFAGYFPDAECDHFYANTDALIFPTYDTEGFPMALFKSVATGMPVITTRIRAAKDHLSEPENVLWIKEQSPEAIAAAVDKLFYDESLRASIQKNNKLLGRNFSVEKVSSLMSENFLSLYN